MVLSKSHMDVSHFDVTNSDDDDDDVTAMDVSGGESDVRDGGGGGGGHAASSAVTDRLLPEQRWLLRQLPQLAQFSSFRQQVCDALRKVINAGSLCVMRHSRALLAVFKAKVE